MKERIDKADKSLAPEKIARIAEEGLQGIKLSNAEKNQLNEYQLEEVYELWDLEKKSIPEYDLSPIKTVLKKYSGSTQMQSLVDICVKTGKKNIELIHLETPWHSGSPAFVIRDKTSGSISFHKNIGKMTIHLGIVNRDENLADIHVELTDSSKKNSYSFEVELIKNSRCVETISTTKDVVASFLAVAIDEYVLRVSDARKEIASLTLRMEQ